MADSSDLTPLQWLARLGPKLVERRDAVDYWRRYFVGDQDLPSGPSQVKDAYKRLQKTARTNLCLLAVESMVHRMQCTGYRDTSGVNDDTVWRLWQQAKLDSRQYTIWRKALSRSACYVTVGVDPRDSGRPRLSIEGPENVIVETDPADSQRRLAALRLWHDSIADRWMATVYLPGERHHYRTRTSAREWGGGHLAFDANRWEERADPGRSLPDVPVIPFLNGDEGEEPRAEFDVGIDVQNRLNLTLLNRLTAERFASFRQRGLLNYVPEEDPATGLPVAPFNPGADQIWTVPPPESPGEPESRFYEFQQTSTSDMLRGTEADMRAFAAVTLTPVYYLPGDLVNISADSVAALDAGHVAKVRQRMAYWGEQLEEVLQLMATVAGVDRDLSSSELVWARPENFNPAQYADYMTKLRGSGVPLPMVAEQVGWTPQQVEQLRRESAQESLQAALSQPLTTSVTPPPPAPVAPSVAGGPPTQSGS